MAKRRNGFSLDGLMAQLSSLDAQRKALVAQIQGAVSSGLGGSHASAGRCQQQREDFSGSEASLGEAEVRQKIDWRPRSMEQ